MSSTTDWQDRRPDPSEPYRYACPNCYRYSLERVHKTTERGKEDYECLSCHVCSDRDELLDRKHDDVPEPTPGYPDRS